MLVSAKKVTFLAGASRSQSTGSLLQLTHAHVYAYESAKIVQPLADKAKEHDIEINVLTRGKDSAANEALWTQAYDELKGVRVGTSGLVRV